MWLARSAGSGVDTQSIMNCSSKSRSQDRHRVIPSFRKLDVECEVQHGDPQIKQGEVFAFFRLSISFWILGKAIGFSFVVLEGGVDDGPDPSKVRRMFGIVCDTSVTEVVTDPSKPDAATEVLLNIPRIPTLVAAFRSGGAISEFLPS